MTSERMRRRYLLKIAGFVGVSSVAGFSGWQLLNWMEQSAESGVVTVGEDNRTRDPESPENTSPENSATDTNARFRIERVETPSTAELGTEFTSKLAITNTGSAERRFKSTLTVTEDGVSVERVPIQLTIPAGETRTWERNESVSYLTTRQYELGEHLQWSVDITRRTEPIGTSVTIGARQITVENLVEKGTEYTDPNGARIGASAGNKWLFLHLSAKNVGEEPVSLPSYVDFSLLADQDNYRDRQFEPSVYTVEQEYQGGFVQPGIKRTGITLFEIPKEVQPANLQVLWHKLGRNGDIIVEWHHL